MRVIGLTKLTIAAVHICLKRPVLVVVVVVVVVVLVVVVVVVVVVVRSFVRSFVRSCARSFVRSFSPKHSSLIQLFARLRIHRLPGAPNQDKAQLCGEMQLDGLKHYIFVNAHRLPLREHMQL